MSQESAALVAAHENGRSRRPTRSISVFLAASLVAHAAVVVGLPDWSRDPTSVQPVVLEVRILKPVPLPATSARPDPTPQPPADPKRMAEKVEPKPERSPPVPALALSRLEPVVDGSFSVAPPRLPEPPPVLDPKTQVASVAVTPPSFNAAYLSNPSPQYPQASRRSGEQGTVMLRVLVLRNGLPTRVEIEKSSGSPYLDGAARDAVWGWRFVPAQLGTDPVEAWVLVPVVFRLEGTSLQGAS